MRVTYEYIRVHLSNIGVHTSHIRVHTSNTRVPTSNKRVHNYIQVHTDTYGNIQVIYEYIVYREYTESTYDGNRIKDMACTIFLLKFYFHVCACLHTHASAHNASATHARVPQTCACATYIRFPYARTNKPES